MLHRCPLLLTSSRFDARGFILGIFIHTGLETLYIAYCIELWPTISSFGRESYICDLNDYRNNHKGESLPIQRYR